ncbi:MAG: hypothetical protein JRN57_03740 [Nitrososphaerota archaeon]|nr:hypothetical protein [Nitrososphaerota archaeon]
MSTKLPYLGWLFHGLELASFALSVYYGYRAFIEFNQVFFFLSLSFLMVFLGVRMYFSTRRLRAPGGQGPSVDTHPYEAGKTTVLDLLSHLIFVFMFCASVVFLYDSVYYETLGYFIGLTGMFAVLLARFSFSGEAKLRKWRVVNLFESYLLGFYSLSSMFFVSFLPRWWDPYYHYSIIHSLLANGHLNVLATYFGFPLFYIYNAVVISSGLAVPFQLWYLVLGSAIEALLMFAFYFIVRRYVGEKASLISAVAVVMTTVFTSYVITPLAFATTLGLFSLSLLIAHRDNRAAVFLSVIVLGVGTLLFHPTGAILIAVGLLATLLVERVSAKTLLPGNRILILLYLAAVLTYLLYVAQSAFTLLVENFVSNSGYPYAHIAQLSAPYMPYYFIYYLPLVLPVVFVAFYLGQSLIEGSSRRGLFLAIYPAAFAALSLSQLVVGRGLAETALSGFVPVAGVLCLGAVFTRLSASRVLVLALVVLLSVGFFASVVAPGDNLYFGKSGFPLYVPMLGTSQQIAAKSLFAALPPSSSVASDGITSPWAYYGYTILDEWNLPLSSSTLSLSNYTAGTYLVYALSSFQRLGVNGNPDEVLVYVSNLTSTNDLVYSSGGVFGTMLLSAPASTAFE